MAKSAVRYQGHHHANDQSSVPCSPPSVCNVKLVKTYKTGSTTVGSLLFRFGLRHALKFYTLPNESDHHASLPACADCNISYHAKGSRMLTADAYRRLVPLGAFITIVREPIARHLSDYYYHFAPVCANGTTADAVHAMVDQGERFYDLSLALDVNVTGKAAEDRQRVARRLDLFKSCWCSSALTKASS